MVGSSKILTVSYGTFSCTLEGFDDSFDTMKAIAEYFRDLAADDRYFGAEPPTPDAEMLARIAEREIERRVEARMSGNGIVLRASDPADGLSAAAALTTAATGLAPRAAAAPEPVSDPQADSQDAEDASVTDDAVAADTSADAAEDDMVVDADEKVGAEAPEIAVPAQPDSDDAIAAQTAEASAEGPADIAEEVAEAEGAEAAASPDDSAPLAMEEDAAAEPGTASDMPEVAEAAPADATIDANVSAAADSDEDDLSPVAETPAERLSPTLADPDSVAAKLQRIRAVVANSNESADTDYAEDQELEGDAPAGAMAAGPSLSDAFSDAEDAETDSDVDALIRQASAFEEAGAQAQPADDQPQALEETPDAAEDDAEEAADLAGQDTGIEADDIDEFDEDAAANAQEAESLRARIVKVKRSELEAAIEDGTLQPEDEDGDVAQHAPASSLSPEDEDALMRELAELEQFESGMENPTPIVDELSLLDDGAETADAVDRVLHTDAAASETPEFDAYDDEDEDEDVAVSAESDHDDTRKADESDETEAGIAAALSGALDDDDMEETEAGEAASLADVAGADTANLFAEDSEDAPDAKETDRTARTDEEAEMSRILAKTNDQLDEPDGSRRRTAIAHLKAAVAATRAESRAGGKIAGAEDNASQFRQDLAQVVRPRRPAGGPARSQRPEMRPAPLKLVAEQRIDTPHAPVQPVRPRRVSARTTMQDDAAVATDQRSFTDFADEMGATQLPDLLEAAAAYMAHVEGQSQFSRPQLMTKVRQVKQDDFSREDGLRSFGKLLRDGKIQKLKGGRFTVSDDIGFKPEAKSA